MSQQIDTRFSNFVIVNATQTNYLSHFLTHTKSFIHSLTRRVRSGRGGSRLSIVLYCTVLSYTHSMLFASVPCNVLFATDSTNCERATKNRFSFSLGSVGVCAFLVLSVDVYGFLFWGDTCVSCVLSTLQQSTNVLRVCSCMCALLILSLFFSLHFLLSLSLFLCRT